MSKPLSTWWMSIDPGLKRTGWALWCNTKLYDYGLTTIKDMDVSGWKLAANLMARRALYGRLQSYAVGFVISEIPEEFASGKGKAALNSGAVRKLSYYVGVLSGVCLAKDIRFASVEPMKWKGNVPKEITEKRVRRDYRQVEGGLFSDVYDAIGIGRWWIHTRGLKA